MIEERFYNKIVSFKKDDIFKKCFLKTLIFLIWTFLMSHFVNVIL